MASAGWYPDPGGQPGMYRYWDGHAWSAATSPNPSVPPPSQGIGQPGDQTTGQQAYGQQGGQQFGQQPYGQYGSAYEAYQQQEKKKSPIGWWIGGGLGLIAIIVVIVLLIRTLGGGSLLGGDEPGGQGSTNPCPTTTASASAKPHPNDGRVHGGPVSYPELGSPWSTPHGDDRVPFGSDVQTQEITIEPHYQGNNSWVASVLIAQLIAGDGFFTPQQGSEIVAKCIVGAFYGDNPVQRHDEESKATKVDGHDAWLLKSHLTFDIEGLKAKGETMTILIIDAGATSGLFYSSIPDNAKQYQPDADRVMSEITVDG
ncbi:DUF2510 domain-containing protein [Microlunatus elymi]|uniref:DUF2510 domain-containing protein n=1 Tax=Microlunatus elymi TaxID=2596828 RepID=UPI00143DCFE9|nr:DUF2510 domain-containing protein [Microlunatus elymi]